MHTAESLLDLHEHAHGTLKTLLAHCRGFGKEEIDRELSGFGYATVRLQLHHLIGAQKYWVGVLEGRIDAEENDPDYPTIESLERYCGEVFALTTAHLRRARADELNAVRAVTTWGDRRREVIPANVILRTLTHIYHHQGQITAMCRLLGRPVEGLDYPLR